MKNSAYLFFLTVMLLALAWLFQGLWPVGRVQAASLVDTHTQHDYVVTFAAVKISDETLKQNNLPSYDEIRTSLEDDHKVARFISDHPDKFSFMVNQGNALPVVKTSETARLHFVLDSQREQQDLATYGMSVTEFDPSISVKGEEPDGTISCTRGYQYLVTLKVPVGNSTGQGGSGDSGFILRAKQPDLTPLFRTKDASLWEFVELDRR